VVRPFGWTLVNTLSVKFTNLVLYADDSFKNEEFNKARKQVYTEAQEKEASNKDAVETTSFRSISEVLSA